MKLALAAVLAIGCRLGPQVPDDPAPSGDIVPAGTPIPSIDDTDDAATIAMNDGVDGVVPRFSAFAAGAPSHVWDFGPAPAFAGPLFRLMRRMSDGSLEEIEEHPSIVGTIPGEAGYSPYWQVFALVVTDAYQGELITSTTAIEEAVRDGLVEAPVAQMLAVDYPVVASDVRVDVGTGTPLAPNETLFYEHHTLVAFDFGEVVITNDVHVPIASRYVLRRDGQEPLSEPFRNVDIDGDGDTTDTNDVFERAAGDPKRSPLSRTVDVAVVATTASIDTTGNDAQAAIMDAGQMFSPGPVAGTVTAYEITDELRNFPAQRQAGGL